MSVKLHRVQCYYARDKPYAKCRLTGTRLQARPQMHGDGWRGDIALIIELAELRGGLSPAFMASVQKAFTKKEMARLYASISGAEIFEKNTTGWLVEEYKSNTVSLQGLTAFCDLRPRTRADYEKDLARLLICEFEAGKVSDLPISTIGIAECTALRDAWAKNLGATQAGRIMRACSVLWGFAMERALVASNPWAAIRPPKKARGKKKTIANFAWTLQEYWDMIDTAPSQALARAYILCGLGIRPEQLVSITRQDLEHGITSEKTSKKHNIHIPAHYAHIFKDDGKVVPLGLVIYRANGLPFKNYNVFRKLFNAHRIKMFEAGKVRPNITIKGLNVLCGSLLAESGLDEETKKATMARSGAMVEHYGRDANTAKLAGQGFSYLEKRMNPTDYTGGQSE